MQLTKECFSFVLCHNKSCATHADSVARETKPVLKYKIINQNKIPESVFHALPSSQPPPARSPSFTQQTMTQETAGSWQTHIKPLCCLMHACSCCSAALIMACFLGCVTPGNGSVSFSMPLHMLHLQCLLCTITIACVRLTSRCTRLSKVVLSLQVLHVLGIAVPDASGRDLHLSCGSHGCPPDCHCQCCWNAAAAVRVSDEWLCHSPFLHSPMGHLVSQTLCACASRH